MGEKASFEIRCVDAGNKRVSKERATRVLSGSHLDVENKVIDPGIEGLSFQLTVNDDRLAQFEMDDILIVTIEKKQPSQ